MNDLKPPDDQSIDWPFIAPMTVLLVLGIVGIVYGGIRDARTAKEAARKRDELRKELDAKPVGKAPYRIPYDLARPDWYQVLPIELNEVSGFAVNAEGEGGWAVNDEEGLLFPFALAEGLMGQPYEFAGRGDYEGLEIVGDQVVVARSDGELYRIRQGKTEKVESLLDYEYDIEGLALDGARSRLLVACKGQAGPGKAFKGMRGIYAVTLPTFEWQETPVYLISFKDLKKFIRDVDVEGMKGSDAKHFAPSGVAVSPDDQHIYVISSVGRMLVVLSVRGEIEAVAPLSRRVHRQPEGLAFDTHGSLYISNEGRDGAGTILRFDPKDANEDADLDAQYEAEE
ncbi:MAG: SdiA-regulated domain-containing protein [Myxococcota bacterium]